MTDATRSKVALSCLVSPAFVVAVLACDATARRRAAQAEQPAVSAVAVRLPTSDLALSGGARWLRAPSLEEPAAAFADGPALPDPDPAGGAMAPPVAVWAEIHERSNGVAALRVKRR